MQLTRIFGIVAGCCLAVAQAAQAGTPPSTGVPVLNVANWNDYIDKDTIAAFEAKHGVAVHYETYVEHGELMDAIDSNQFDVVVPDSVTLGSLISAGKVQPFDTSSMLGFKDVQAILSARMRAKDASGQHAVPYMWGRIGVAVYAPKVREALGVEDIPNSLDVVFSPENMPRLAQCGITVIDSHLDVFAMLMHYKGRTLDHVSERKVREFGTWLNDLAPYVSKVDASDYLEDLPAGRNCVSLVWEGDGRTMAKESANIEFFLPAEGTALYIDSMVITASSKNKELAEKFIDFMATPDIAKRNAEYTSYNSPSITAAQQLETDGVIEPLSMTEVPVFLPPTIKPALEENLIHLWTEFSERVNNSEPESKTASAEKPGVGESS